jgi:hypothetical protein
MTFVWITGEFLPENLHCCRILIVSEIQETKISSSMSPNLLKDSDFHPLSGINDLKKLCSGEIKNIPKQWRVFHCWLPDASNKILEFGVSFLLLSEPDHGQITDFLFYCGKFTLWRNGDSQKAKDVGEFCRSLSIGLTK